MSEREVVLDQPVLFDEAGEAVRKATERAEKAEAELAKLKSAATHKAATSSSAKTDTHKTSSKAAPSIESDPAEDVTTTATASSDASTKNPPSPSSAHAAATGTAVGNTGTREQGHAPRDPKSEAPSDGEAELRNDSMMAHLLDSLDEGKDIGHYGRLTFAMVARHFLPHEEVVSWLTRDNDFSEEQADLMLHQVEGRDYSPPKRDRILQWQKEQDFPILPHPDDPDCGNLYRNLKFPQEIYSHISHYQEQKAESSE